MRETGEDIPLILTRQTGTDWPTGTGQWWHTGIIDRWHHSKSTHSLLLELTHKQDLTIYIIYVYVYIVKDLIKLRPIKAQSCTDRGARALRFHFRVPLLLLIYLGFVCKMITLTVFQLGIFLRALCPARTGLRPARFTSALPELF